MRKTIRGLRIRFRVDLSPACSIGPGKIELLEGIGRSGSLAQAARDLGLSYRRAWILLQDLNCSFGGPLTKPNKGGRGGGGATLTAAGEEIIRCYRTVAQVIEPVVRSTLRPIAAKAVLQVSGNNGVPAKRKRLARRIAAIDRARSRIGTRMKHEPPR